MAISCEKEERMCEAPENDDKNEEKKKELLAKANELYQEGLEEEIKEVYEEPQKKFEKILKGQSYSFSSYWNNAYKELANINKLKREKIQRCFRVACPFLPLLGCILIGLALGVYYSRILEGFLGGAGVGLLLMTRCILSISGENDY